MKKSDTKRIIQKNTDCAWFDSENARLIILCATLGVFGAHKFAQHKNFQGILYILLDLTVFGLFVTLILAWFDLIFLTAKSDNKPGNMLLGTAFILFASFILIPGSSKIVIKNINPQFVEKTDSEIVSDSTDTNLVVSDTADTIVVVEEDAGIVENNENVIGGIVVDFPEPVQQPVVEEQIAIEAPVVTQAPVVVAEEAPVVEPTPVVVAEPVKTVVENVEPAVQAKPVVEAVQKPKIRPKQPKKPEVPAEKEKAFDDFSLYDMITNF